MRLKDFQAWPKIELHRHLEGSLRLSTLWEFHGAQRQDRFPDFHNFRAACTVAKGQQPGFQKFLECFASLRFTYGGPQELARLAAEAVEDAAADGVVHLELRFSPVFFARRLRSCPPSDQPPPWKETECAAETIIGAAQDAARRTGIKVFFLLSAARHFPPEIHRLDLLQRASGKDFKGLDICGLESAPLADFIPVIREWQRAGRAVVIHAGEDPNGRGAASVQEALELGATRIGHGVRAWEDPDVVDQLVSLQTPLELCLTSNVQTRACSSYATHPLKGLLEAGVRVTLNTDDPTICQTTLSQEYLHAWRDCGLSLAQLRGGLADARK